MQPYIKHRIILLLVTKELLELPPEMIQYICSFLIDLSCETCGYVSSSRNDFMYHHKGLCFCKYSCWAEYRFENW